MYKVIPTMSNYLGKHVVFGVGSEMGKGDPGMEDIYNWDPVTGPRVAFKGPTGTTGQPKKIAVPDCTCRAHFCTSLE